MSEKLTELQQLLQEVRELKAQVAALSNNGLNTAPVGRSFQINELAAALAKAQGEMKVARMDSQNAYFKSSYADLNSVVEASRPALTKYGLSVSHLVTTGEEGQTILRTLLMHEKSGQFLESVMRVTPGKNDIHSIGSYITYLKRYVYSAMTGVVSSGDDDDGEAAMTHVRNKSEQGTALNTKYDPRNESAELISKDQIAELEYELAAYPDIAEQLFEGLRINSLADMPKSKYRPSIERVRSIKNARNGIK
jgi:hypothetical protein